LTNQDNVAAIAGIGFRSIKALHRLNLLDPIND